MSLVEAARNLVANPAALPGLIRDRLAVQARGTPAPPPNLEITRTPDAGGALVAAIDAALLRARKPDQQPSLPEPLLALSGMSGRGYRELINAIVRNVPHPRYLEVGVWSGSTFCSAIHGNNVRALAIDNWSEFGGDPVVFYRNLGRFGGRAQVSVLTSDFRAAPFDAVGRHNIYMFDGPHSEQDHFDGLALAMPALEQEFILIVDDWNWAQVRSGTRAAISRLGLTTKLTAQIRTTLDDRHAADAGLPANEKSDWHNGYFIGVMAKP